MNLRELESMLLLLFNKEARTLINVLKNGTEDEVMKAIDDYGLLTSYKSEAQIKGFILGEYIKKVDNVSTKELRVAPPLRLKVRSNIEDATKAMFADKKTISSRIWANTEKTKIQLREALTLSLSEGVPIVKTAREFKELTGSSYNNAVRLVRTETIAARNQAALDTYTEFGIKEIVVIESQEGACPICSPKDGMVVKVVDAVIGETIPPFHPRCKGTIRAKKQIS